MQLRDPEASTKKLALGLEAVQLHQLGLTWFNYSTFGLRSFPYAALHCVSKYGSVLWRWTAFQKHTRSIIRKVPLDDSVHMYSWTHSGPALMAPSNCPLAAAEAVARWTALPLMSGPMEFPLSTPSGISPSSFSTSEIWFKQHTVFSAQERSIRNLYHFLSLRISQNDVFGSNMSGSQGSFVFISPYPTRTLKSSL